VIAPDLPGYGRSPTPPRPLDVPQLADALLDWLDLLEVERAVLVANSLGCQVAVDLAARRPERVERLVLVGPTMDPAAPTIPRQALRLARDVVRESPLLNLAQTRDYVRMGPRRILATGRFALDDPLEEKLPRVAAPALVIRGARDTIVSQEWAERVAALLPRGRLAVVDAAHAAHWGAADAVARLVEEPGDG
jgi:pimeloyl-ACP methyl ester carboxylesterase